MKKRNDDITIKSLVDIFVPKLWLMLIVSTLLGALLGGYSYFFKSDTYTSFEKYMVSKINYSNAQASTGLTTSEIAAMQGMIANAQEIIDTNSFATKVIVKLKEKHNRTDLDETRKDHVYMIRNMMSVRLASDTTTCYYFVATSGNPELAYQVADVAGDLLVAEYAETKYAIEFKCLEGAAKAAAPNSKNVTRNAVIGFAVGFIFTALLVFLSSRFDVIIRSREKIEDNFDIPILGTIPRLEQNN